MPHAPIIEPSRRISHRTPHHTFLLCDMLLLLSSETFLHPPRIRRRHMPFIAAALYLLTYIDKLSRAWKTPTKWYPIPIALGALVLVAVQWRKQKPKEPLVETQGPDGAVVRAEGPWQVSSH